MFDQSWSFLADDVDNYLSYVGSKRELHTGTNPGTQNCETMRNCTRPQVSQSFGDWWSRWKVANLWSGTPLCHCALSVLKVSHRSEEGIKYDQVEGYNIRLYTIEMIHFFLTERPSTIVLPNFLQLKPTSLRIRLGCSPIDSKSVSFQTFESCWPVTYASQRPWSACTPSQSHQSYQPSTAGTIDAAKRCALVWHGNHLSIKNHSTNSVARWLAGRFFIVGGVGKQSWLVGKVRPESRAFPMQLAELERCFAIDWQLVVSASCGNSADVNDLGHIMDVNNSK